MALNNYQHNLNTPLSTKDVNVKGNITVSASGETNSGAVTAVRFSGGTFTGDGSPLIDVTSTLFL